jgi:hypothetical protein
MAREEARGVLDGDVGEGKIIVCGLGRRLASDEAAPCFVTFVNDLGGIFLILGFTGEGERVLGLSIGDFIDTEPLVRCPNETRQMPFNILNIVQLGRKRIVNVDDENLPIGLAFVEKGHDAQDFDLLDLADIAYLFSDFTDVERVVVAFCFCFGMNLVGVFPSLGESTVVPDVAMVGEAIPDVSQFTLFDILLDRIKRLLFGDLHLGVCPARDLDDHVEDAIVLVCEERDVVEGGDNLAVVLCKDSVIESVGCADETGCVLGHMREMASDKSQTAAS